MNSEKVIKASKYVTTLRILAVISIVVGIILEIMEFDAIIEGLVIGFGFALLSTIQRGNDILRQETKEGFKEVGDELKEMGKGFKKFLKESGKN
jgi:hypothetical protein